MQNADKNQLLSKPYQSCWGGGLVLKKKRKRNVRVFLPVKFYVGQPLALQGNKTSGHKFNRALPSVTDCLVALFRKTCSYSHS